MEENMQALMDRLNSSSQFLQSNDMHEIGRASCRERV